jgi:3-oxoacyl-[acyl-carrier-protein] synthase-3
MKYSKVYLSSLGYELAPNVVTSAELEDRVAPVYEKLGLPLGQLEALTGIRERRWWDPGHKLSDGAIAAAKKALYGSGVKPSDLGAVIYAGVCRENSEPATACAVAAGLGASPDAAVFDVSNACLGVINGMVDIANRIELGQIRAGLVVSCESAREINESMIESMRRTPTMEHFRVSIATLTGGSGAVACLLTDGGFAAGTKRRLLGGAHLAAPEHHGLCLWNRDHMMTDASSVLREGAVIARDTYAKLLRTLGWGREGGDKFIAHQVGGAHRAALLENLGIAEEKDFSTYEFLGNIGTVSLPLTAALAEEREFLSRGNTVTFLGIGSGLNCMMLGWQW